MPHRNMRGPRNEGCGTGRKRGRLAEHNANHEHRNHANQSLRDEISVLKSRVDNLEKHSQSVKEEG